MSFKAWCFTINNVDVLLENAGNHAQTTETEPGRDESDGGDARSPAWFSELFTGFLEYGERRSIFRYCCFQLETAGTTGNRHCQGYIYLQSARRMGYVKRFIGELGLHAGYGTLLQPHCERSRGTPQQNRDYCSKPATAIPGTFREIGTLPRQGDRTDLNGIAEAIAEGAEISSIAAEFPIEFIKYSKGIQALKTALSSKPRPATVDPTVYWWFGPTGTGKSRLAFETYPDAYIKMPTNKWWDGYVDQAEVILDDYRPSMCPFHELLRLLDRYPMKVEFKGGSTELQATTFVITTCERPELLWQGKTDEMIDQLIRRITEIRHFTPTGTTILKDGSTAYVKTPTDGSIVTTFRPFFQS
jgi:hypothetical protein